MFNKETSSKVLKIKINNKDFYKQYNNIYITPFFVMMINKYHEDKNMQEHLDFDKKVTNYVDKSFEYNIKKQYNNTFSKLYYSGKIIIDNESYELKDFYIVYMKNEPCFHLMCTNPKYSNEKTKYNQAVKLIDTTAFISIIKNGEIKENTIIINKNDLLNIVNIWNGMLHDKVSITDAINNKKMVDNYEYE